MYLIGESIEICQTPTRIIRKNRHSAQSISHGSAAMQRCSLQAYNKENCQSSHMKSLSSVILLEFKDKKTFQAFPLVQQAHKAISKRIPNGLTIKSFDLPLKSEAAHLPLSVTRVSNRATPRNQDYFETGLLSKIILEPHKAKEQFLQDQQRSSVVIGRSPKLHNLTCLDSGFENRLVEYQKMLQSTCEFHGFTKNEIKLQPVAFIGPGNNSALIRDLLKRRWWWNFRQDRGNKPDFIWTQLKERSYYGDVDERANNLHNHFESNEFLGNKKALFYQMSSYYSHQGIDVFSKLPLTFHVKSLQDPSWHMFIEIFKKALANQSKNQSQIWIVKPGENSNRGNGISVHRNLETIKQLLTDEGQKERTFIIQKYIEKPFLYNRRKFDIRCYMLLVRLNGSIKGYWYEQGYIRTSCYEFKLDDTQNQYIHLTNDAIQVNCDRYGKFEDGNKLSFAAFQRYLDTNYKGQYCLETQILPQLKAMATDSIKATFPILGKWKNCPTFEIFGLDFMIDQEFNPWLIQVNTNPCLETNCAVLKHIIPNMVDNAFKLSLDCIFSPPEVWPSSKRYLLPNKVSQNKFQLIFDEAKHLLSPSEQLAYNLEGIGAVDEDEQVFQETKKQK